MVLTKELLTQILINQQCIMSVLSSKLLKKWSIELENINHCYFKTEGLIK